MGVGSHLTFFETWSHCVAPAGFELTEIHLPLPPHHMPGTILFFEIGSHWPVASSSRQSE